MNNNFQITPDGNVFEVLPDGSVSKVGKIDGFKRKANRMQQTELSTSVVWWKEEDMHPISMYPLQNGFPLSLYVNTAHRPNHLRRMREELLDTDFIQTYQRKNVRYAIVARGTSRDRKYGIFNVRSIQLVIPFIYDKLEWIDKDETLIAILQGKKLVIDVKGNEFF